jgi:hypothetical protein
MEFIHVLVEQRTTTGARLHDNNVTDMRRLTIFDLPGELRNNIYGCILADDQPVVVLYGEPTASASPYSTWRTDPPSPAPIPSKITQLLNMSWANRELRKEVRSYFFANNKIEVTGISGATFTTFLDKISADGRANAVVLNLSGTNFWMYYNLYRIIAELVRLREFNITMDVGHLLSFEGSMNIHSYVHCVEHKHCVIREQIGCRDRPTWNP